MFYKKKEGVMDNITKYLSKIALFFFAIVAVSFFLPGNSLALTDEECIECHSDEDLTTEKNGETISLFMDSVTFAGTVHAENGCVSCHEDADVGEDEHPFPMSQVNCENCHDGIGDIYKQSAHGEAALAKNDRMAPRCKDCHTKHNILPPTDKRASTYPLNIPFTCGRCHSEGSEMTKTHDLNQHNIVENYSMSIHGKGLFVDGLIVTAVCTSCHTAHNVQKASNPESTVNRDNIVDTCNQCHVGIVDQFKLSVHGNPDTNTDKKRPVCIDCHNSHTIAQVDRKDFRLIIANQCGNCHAHESETYFETYHGRASMLWGGEKTAKCSDCHGSHNIMPIDSEKSTINEANIVETCAKCHPRANKSFTTYLTHATHNDREKYPYLFYTFWAMTGLLVGTFAFFGLHTILWVPRAIIERIKASTDGKTSKDN
jgi:hypothetical protein